MITIAGADDETVHVFSLASGHLYERFLKIMMMSVLERTDRKVAPPSCISTSQRSTHARPLHR